MDPESMQVDLEATSKLRHEAQGEPARDQLNGEELYNMTESGTPQYSQPFDIKIDVQVPMSDGVQPLDRRVPA